MAEESDSDDQIEILMLDDETTSDTTSDTGETSASNQSPAFISSSEPSKAFDSDNPSDLLKLKYKPEYQTLLKKIRFNIETMTRSELENFCFTKVESEIESRSLYQCKLEELKNINNELKLVKNELSTLKEKNLQLMESTKYSVRGRRGKHYYKDASVQVGNEDIMGKELNTKSSVPTLNIETSDRKPYIKVKDFSKDSSLTSNHINYLNQLPINELQSSVKTLDNSLLQNLYYIIPTENNLQGNNLPLVVNQPVRAPFQGTFGGTVHDNSQLMLSLDSNQYLHTTNTNNIEQMQSVTKRVAVKTEKLLEVRNLENTQTVDKNVDIEDTLPHALITCTDKSKPKNFNDKGDGKRVEVFNVVRSIDLTNSTKENIGQSGINNSEDSVEPTMPLIISTVSLAPDNTPQIILQNTQHTSGLPVILSTQSLAQNASKNTATQTRLSTDNSDNSISASKEVPSSGQLLFTIDPSGQMSRLPITGGESFNNNMLIAIHPDTSEDVNKIVISSESQINTTAEPGKVVTSTPTPKTFKKINFGIFRPEISSSSTDYSVVTSQASPLAVLPQLNNVTSQPSISIEMGQVKTINTSKKCLNVPKLSPHNILSSPSSNSPKAMQSEKSSGEPAKKKVCHAESWSYTELQRQITDKFSEAFNKGNLANGISIKLDVNGATKVVTCTNINIASLQRMVDEQNYEKNNFVDVFSRAIFNKINKSIGLEESKKITIRRCDIIEKPKNIVSSKNYKLGPNKVTKNNLRSGVIVLED